MTLFLDNELFTHKKYAKSDNIYWFIEMNNIRMFNSFYYSYT